MFTAWRVSHAERREEREAAGEDDDEEDDTPVVILKVIPSSAVTTYPKGTPVPTPSITVQVIEERVDLSNNMTGRQMIGVGVRRVVLARGELDKLEGPQYAARRAELRREAGEAARARDRQAVVAPQNDAEESGATEEEETEGRRTRVGRPRGGMRVAARIGDRLRREIGRGRRPRACVAAASRISDVLPQGGCVPGSGDEGRGRRPTFSLPSLLPLSLRSPLPRSASPLLPVGPLLSRLFLPLGAVPLSSLRIVAPRVYQAHLSRERLF